MLCFGHVCHRLILILLSLFFVLSALAQSAEKTGEYLVLEWTDLIPKEDLDALLNPPEYLDDIEDGSEEDLIASQIKNTIAQASDSAYQRALVSTRVKTEYNGKKVRIPGFIVPLDFDENQTITSFFIVPFFGACIHVPPPPPNQIIYASFKKGLTLEHLYDPFWIEGTIKTEIQSNELGTAAYTMRVDNTFAYTE